jgi:DnaJ-domain-containing protein 1
MSINPVELTTIDELYEFVESAIERTGLVLATDALFRPWARAVSAECQDVRWLYPSQPLSEHLLQHLANFSHAALPDKGFVLFEQGRIIKVVDVDAVNGSSRPDRLGGIVRDAFTQKARRPGTGTKPDRASIAAGDPYQVLGASEADADEEIKKKYKHMIMEYHPDRVAHLGAELRELAARKTTEINAAFATIRRTRGF